MPYLGRSTGREGRGIIQDSASPRYLYSIGEYFQEDLCPFFAPARKIGEAESCTCQTTTNDCKIILQNSSGYRRTPYARGQEHIPNHVSSVG